jgi:hypothetical protein
MAIASRGCDRSRVGCRIAAFVDGDHLVNQPMNARRRQIFIYAARLARQNKLTCCYWFFSFSLGLRGRSQRVKLS